LNNGLAAGQTDCDIPRIDLQSLLTKIKQHSIAEEEMVRANSVRVDTKRGFEDVDKSVRQSVMRRHLPAPDGEKLTAA
jgi:hypothetical protein